MQTGTLLEILSPLTSSPNKKLANLEAINTDGIDQIEYTTPTGRVFTFEVLSESPSRVMPVLRWAVVEKGESEPIAMTSTPGTLLADFVSALLFIL